MAYVYRHIRLDTNQVFYIGIGTSANYKRAKSKLDRNNHWNHIICKTDYKIDILFDELTKEEAIVKEIEFITLYGRRDLGLGTLCNLTDGGEGRFNYKATAETRIKMGLAQRGNKKYLLRTTPQEEINRKVSLVNTGRVVSEETKAKIKAHQEKYGHPSLGKRQSEETKVKIANTKVKFPVVQKDLDGNVVKIWESTKAVRKEGYTQVSVWRCCHKKQKSYKGYNWEFLNNNK
jgi:hypothetical protein